MNKFLFFLLSFLLLISCQKKQRTGEDAVLGNKKSENTVSNSKMKESTVWENKTNELELTNSIEYLDISPYQVYNFVPGDYYMLDYPVRIRSEPDLQGKVIGTLGMNSKIKIISSVHYDKVLSINGVRAIWYEIEFEGIKGYVWGGYISARTLVYDIDNNGIDDYFHYRVSKIQGPHYYYVNAQTDVIIYLNNKKIPTTDIYSIYPEGYTMDSWGECFFESTERHTVLIIMYYGEGGEVWEDTFEMDATGKIVLIKQRHEEGVME